MLQVLQVGVRRAPWRRVCFLFHRVPAAGWAGLVAGSEAAAGRAVTRQLCSRDRRTAQSCTVDPRLEERFVFLDCAGETEVRTDTSTASRSTRGLTFSCTAVPDHSCDVTSSPLHFRGFSELFDALHIDRLIDGGRWWWWWKRCRTKLSCDLRDVVT